MTLKSRSDLRSLVQEHAESVYEKHQHRLVAIDLKLERAAKEGRYFERVELDWSTDFESNDALILLRTYARKNALCFINPETQSYNRLPGGRVLVTLAWGDTEDGGFE